MHLMVCRETARSRYLQPSCVPQNSGQDGAEARRLDVQATCRFKFTVKNFLDAAGK
jgi:hypothetical protein